MLSQGIHPRCPMPSSCLCPRRRKLCCIQLGRGTWAKPQLSRGLTMKQWHGQQCSAGFSLYHMQPTVPLLGWMGWMQLKQLVCVVGPNPYSPMTTESGIQNVNRRTRVCLFIAIRSILFLDDNTLSLQQWYTTPCHRVCPLTQNSLLIEEIAHSCSHHFEGSLSSLWGFALTL